VNERIADFSLLYDLQGEVHLHRNQVIVLPANACGTDNEFCEARDQVNEKEQQQ
jgi:hypothetical protein